MCNCIECVGYQREPTDEELLIAELEAKLAEAQQTLDGFIIASNQQLVAALAREQQAWEALKETVEALGLLSFHCDGITHTQAPQRTIYNSTYEVYRRQQAALATKPDDAPLKAHVAKEQANMLREMAYKVLDSHTTDKGCDALRRKADELEGKK